MKKLILALVILLTSFSFNSCNKEELKEVTSENLKQASNSGFISNYPGIDGFGYIPTGNNDNDPYRPVSFNSTSHELTTVDVDPDYNAARPTVNVMSFSEASNSFIYQVSYPNTSSSRRALRFSYDVQALYIFNGEIFAVNMVEDDTQGPTNQNQEIIQNGRSVQIQTRANTAIATSSVSTFPRPGYSTPDTQEVIADTGDWEIAVLAGYRITIRPSARQSYNRGDINGEFDWFFPNRNRNLQGKHDAANPSRPTIEVKGAYYQSSTNKLNFTCQAYQKQNYVVKVLQTFYYESLPKDKNTFFEGNFSLSYTKIIRMDRRKSKTDFDFKDYSLNLAKVPKVVIITQKRSNGTTYNFSLNRKSASISIFRGDSRYKAIGTPKRVDLKL